MDFSQLTVIVEGYQVTGYGPGSSLDKFIINIAEHSSLDTDATPRWWISFNNSLKGIPGTNKFVFTKPAPPPYDVSHGEVPIDAAPPILGYTLGIAGKSEIFLHFSEPVYCAPATSPVVADFIFTVGTNPALSVPIGGVNWVTRGSDNVGYLEILLTLNRALLPDDLVLPTVINIAATVQDKAANAITLPPAGHRVSAICLGLLLGGLIEPVWAHDETQTGSFLGGIGLIQLGGFDGTKWLRVKQNLTVEGNIAALSIQPYPPNTTGTKLWYDIDVAAALRNPGGVCLPGFQDNVTADGGGSNGARLRLWKRELQKLAGETRLSISVCHFPPGTSKWNKVEHRLFSFISSNWRGEPLREYETIVNLISGTRTAKGLQVTCRLDRRKYPTGRKVTNEEMNRVNLKRKTFHGDWNYTIHPSTR
jgi:hypothetical protein